MKIVSWNCHEHFSIEKSDLISESNPDILIIQECDRICELLNTFSPSKLHPVDCRWYGNTINRKNSGVAVFLFNSCKFECFPECFPKYRGEFKYILPFEINVNDEKFALFAVWAKKAGEGDKDTPYTYSEQIIEATKNYLFDKSTIMIGDFNTGNKTKSDIQYKNLDCILNSKGLYNCAENEAKDEIHTYFKGGESWIDDFCYASNDLLARVKQFEIGDKQKYVTSKGNYGRSDHCPLIVTFQ
jgi:exonuclease III